MMHPRLEALFTALDAHRAVLADAVASVPEELRERRLVADRWSVAEILEHLSLVETRVAQTVATKIAAGRAAGLAHEEDSSPLPPSKRLVMVMERQQRVPAPDVLEPRSGMSIAQAWAALDRSRQALREAALSGDGLALGTLSSPHPFAGPFNLYQWIAFVGAHEVRHAAQIREIAGEGLTIRA
jgi:hypothetical protein